MIVYKTTYNGSTIYDINLDDSMENIKCIVTENEINEIHSVDFEKTEMTEKDFLKLPEFEGY